MRRQIGVVFDAKTATAYVEAGMRFQIFLSLHYDKPDGWTVPHPSPPSQLRPVNTTVSSTAFLGAIIFVLSTKYPAKESNIKNFDSKILWSELTSQCIWKVELCRSHFNEMPISMLNSCDMIFGRMKRTLCLQNSENSYDKMILDRLM